MRVLVLLAAALSAARLSALTLEEVSLGEHVSGPRLSIQDMRGKVVLIDYWGVECPKCIEEMPGYQTLYERYKEENFHLVAFEKQRHSLNDINAFFANNAFIRQARIQYQITFGDQTVQRMPYVPSRYAPFLPVNYLFGPDGNIVATSIHGDDLEMKVRELIQETWLKLIVAGNADVTKPESLAILARLRSGRNIMEALKDLAVRRRESTDAAEQMEVARIFNALFTAAYKKFDKAMSQKDTFPVKALYSLESLARDLKGCAIADKAAQAADEIRKDPRTIAEFRAEAQLREIITHISDLRPGTNGTRDPGDPEFRAVNRAGLEQMGVDCQRLLTTFPGTDAAIHVRGIIDDFQLRVNE